MRLTTLNARRSVWLLALACLVLLTSSWGSAADRTFSRRFPATGQPALNTTGDISIIGNTLETCTVSATPTAPATCAASVLTTAPSVVNTNNNQFNMIYLDQDGTVGNTTFNSSQSTLNIPATATVKWAGLYWGGDVSATTAPSRNTVKFATPVAAYRSVTAAVLDAATSANKYQGYADVTADVVMGRNGVYAVADVQSTINAIDKFAGWSLVVVYEDASEKPRNLAVFDGLVSVGNGAPQTITVSPFTAPPSGQINARVGVVAYEGDRGTTGDALNMSSSSNGTTYTPAVTMTDTARPADNFFDSGISLGGSNTAIVRTPSYANQLGFDIAMLDVNNPGLNTNNAVIKLGATSARLNFTSTGDVYVPGVVTTAIDIFAPSVTSNLSKTVVDLNGGGLEPGDVLEYTIGAKNTGQDGTSNLILTDALPTGITYLPGSLSVATGANAGPKTDAAGDDQGNYTAGTRTLTVRLATGANATSGGNLAPTETTSVTFRATVDAATARGTVIDNSGTVNFTAQTLGTAYTGTTPVASITVSRPDLTLSKTHTGNLTVGLPASFSFTVSNVGPGIASGPSTITDALPAGLSLSDGAVTLGGANAASWSCTSASNTVTCTSSAAIAPGASSSVALTGIVVGGAAAPSVTNAARVSTSDETLTGNNDASDTAAVLITDLKVAKTHGSGFSPGGPGQYIITVRNAGTAASSGTVTVTDLLPAPLTGTAIAGSGWTCDLGTLSCARSDSLAAGASYPVITLDVTVEASPPPSTINTVTVSGGSDGNAANNSADDLTSIPSGVALSGVVYADANTNGQRDSGETGLSGVTLTLRDNSGNVLASATTDAAGRYRFPTLPAGRYTVTGSQPAGYVATSPESLGVTITNADVTTADFGVFAGSRVSGQVFRDDGWGASATQANDGLRNGTEAGIGNFTVTASSGSGLVASGLTDGNGRYTLYLSSSAGTVTVLASPVQGATYTATGVNDGSVVLHRATGATDPLASQVVVNASSLAGTVQTLSFGLVPQLNLTPDAAQAVTSPGSVIYQQRLTPGTPGTLALSITLSSGSVFSYQLWHDLNGNGVIDPGSDMLLGTGGTLTLTSTSARNPDGRLADLALLLSVSTPPGVASGLSDPARLSVAQTVANLNNVTRVDSVTDTTTTGLGRLTLTKFVRNVTAAAGFSLSNTEGTTGDTLEYCINYQNQGAALLESVTLTDPVPYFTDVTDGYGAGQGVRHVPGTLVTAGAGTTPGSATDNLTSAADADAGTLSPRLLSVGLSTLGGGRGGTVCYRVVVQ